MTITASLASRENPTYWDAFDWDEAHFDGTLAGATSDVSLTVKHAAALAATGANAAGAGVLRAAHKATLAATAGNATASIGLSAYCALRLGASTEGATSQIVLRPAHKATLDALAGDALADLTLRIRDELTLAATADDAAAAISVVVGRVLVFVKGQAEDAAAALVGQIALKAALDSVAEDAASAMSLVSRHMAALVADATDATADLSAAAYVALRMNAGSDAFAQIELYTLMPYRIAGVAQGAMGHVRVRTTPPRFPISSVPTVGMSGAFLPNTPARQGGALPVTAI